jgi:hypothetical protein
MDAMRRTLLGTAAAALLAGNARPLCADDEPADLHDPIPAPPAKPTPGRAGDFAFLDGAWRIRHWRRRAEEAAWDAFDGEATCHSLLGGVASVEELRIPARDFSGMGLRLLDPATGVWSDYWVNAKVGVLAGAGLTGSFEDGAGLFYARETDAQGELLGAGIWDRIGAGRCRWRQATSRDSGLSWRVTWIMHWSQA